MDVVNLGEVLADRMGNPTGTSLMAHLEKATGELRVPTRGLYIGVRSGPL